jgi:hypothetical protein
LLAEGFLLIMMDFMGAGGGAGSECATDVAEFALVDDGLHLLFDIVPRTHIFRLLLNPIELGVFGITA